MRKDAGGPVPICYLIGSLERCGTAIHLLGVLRHLDRNRFVPWVVGLSEPGPIGDAIRSLGIEVWEFDRKSAYSWHTLRTLVWLVRRIRRTRTRIVQSYLFFDNLIGPLAGRLGGAQGVITGRRTVDEWESPRHRWIYRRTNRLVDRIAVVSPDVAESVYKWERAPASKVALIGNAQSRETLLARSDPAEDALLQDLDRSVAGGFVFGTVGNVRPIKGHDVLVKAFHKVVQKHPDAHLVIVGDIYPGPPWIEKMIGELRLGASVHLVGYRANVAGFMERFSAFVLPSLGEGMSNALLEALLMGKPTIATRFGLPRTAEGDDVVLPVEPGDVEGLAAAMERVLADGEFRNRLSAQAQAYADADMNEGRMVRQYEALYEELMGGRPRPAPESANPQGSFGLSEGPRGGDASSGPKNSGMVA